MIPSDPPIAGTVLRYRYLWAYQEASGRDTGEKDRPAALLVSRSAVDGTCVVLPITHRVPDDPELGIEIPAETRARIGLDDRPSWIILSEVNHFTWPGPDLRAVPGSAPETAIYGRLPKALFATVLQTMQALIRRRTVSLVRRSDDG